MTWNSKHGNRFDGWISSWVICSSREELMVGWIVTTASFRQDDDASSCEWHNFPACCDGCVWKALKSAVTIEITQSVWAKKKVTQGLVYVDELGTIDLWTQGIFWIWLQTFNLGLFCPDGFKFKTTHENTNETNGCFRSPSRWSLQNPKSIFKILSLTGNPTIGAGLI